MAPRVLFGALAGATLGMLVGFIGRRAGGSCPLVCNPYGGALYGAFLGAFIGLSLTLRPASWTPSPHVVAIDTTQAFEEKVLRGEGPVLVEFYTQLCPACRRLEPELHAFADRFAGRVKVAHVDAARLRDLSLRYEIGAVPTLILFSGGRQVARTTGYLSASQLARLVEPYLPSVTPASEP